MRSTNPILAVVSVLFAWIASTWLFWTGYVGADDLFYARYAYLWHRPPMNWWEFRTLNNFAIRCSFSLFGPNEFAAAVPNLVCSLLLLAAIAWMIDWPRQNTWYKQAGMFLAVLIPFDIGFRVSPGAAYMGGIVVCLGMILMLGPFDRVAPPVCRYAGAVVLALGFSVHEMMLFPIGIFCAVLLAFNWRLYLKPVIVVGAVAAFMGAIEAAVYQRLLGDPLARLHIAAKGAETFILGQDLDAGISGIRYYLWPFEVLTVAKPFPFALVTLAVLGPLCWKRLNEVQRTLFCATFAIWFWFGWGTTSPTAYRPAPRLVHHYAAVLPAIITLLPLALWRVFERRPLVAKLILAGFIALFLVDEAGGGRWGQTVVTSKQLLRYARTRTDQTFLTDVDTFNEMYVTSGFKVPENVICLNGPHETSVVMLNKEPAGTPLFHFPETKPTAILVNRERGRESPELAAFREQHPGTKSTVYGQQTKLLFRPFQRWLGSRSFAILNLGGEVIQLN